MDKVWNRKAVSYIIIIFCIIIIISSNIPKVRAGSAGFIQSNTNAGSNEAQQSTSYNNPVQNGDLLIAFPMCENDNSDPGATMSVTDSLGNTYTTINSTYPNGIATNAPAFARITIFTAFTRATGNDTVTIACGHTFTLVRLSIAEFNGVGSINSIMSQYQTGSSSGTLQTQKSVSFTGMNNIILTGIFGASITNLNWSPGTGFTGFATSPCCETASQYALSGVTSPTQFPSSTSANGQWNIVGAVINYNPLSQTQFTSTSYTYTTVTVTPALSACQDTNSCLTNQFTQFTVVLLPSIILIALAEYTTYKIGIKDERVYVVVFMFALSAVGFLSFLGGFGQNGIPWYIAIFGDIIGFMLIITHRPGAEF